MFTGDASGWVFSNSLDDPANAGSRGLTPTPTGQRSASGPGRLNNEAFNLFRQADTRGTSKPALPGAGSAGTITGTTPVGQDNRLVTVHQNSITFVEPYSWAQDGSVDKVTTAGADGRIVIWTVAGKGGLSGRMAGMHM
jgi:actin related protein 2/3 complex subunit 1A/1B